MKLLAVEPPTRRGWGFDMFSLSLESIVHKRLWLHLVPGELLQHLGLGRHLLEQPDHPAELQGEVSQLLIPFLWTFDQLNPRKYRPI